MSDSLGTRNRVSERRRGTTGSLCNHGFLLALVLIALLSALTGCGSGQTDVGQTNGNSVPVSLNISMPQDSATASTSGSRFWATVQSWLPSVTSAWAQQQTPTPLSAIQVDVTGPDLAPISTTKNIPPGTLSGSTFTLDLDVPVGPGRVFTVSGLDAAGKTIRQGISSSITLTVGQPATVDIVLAGLGQPTISSPASLPIGVVRTPYSAQLTATGGTEPYTWSVAPPLPAGLTFTPAGSTATIGGTSGIARTTNHTFSVTDSTSPTPRTGTRSYSITIAPPGLTITTPSLPNGTAITQRYSATVTAAGGTSPYTWSIVGGLTPAPGLSLSPSGPTAGQISGTPSTNAGSPFTRTYQVQDSAVPPQTATQSLSIAVNLPSPPNITTRTLPNGTFRQSYNQTLQVLGGTPPFAWSFTGTLPPGLDIRNATGEITGTASAIGTFNFTPQVVDATGQTDPTPPALSITITSPRPPIITTPSPLPTGTVNQPYPVTTLTATGGAPPLTWNPVVTPPLPNGLSFNPNTATISGTPLSVSQPTTHTFTVQDSTAPSNQTGTKGLLLTINSDLTINTTSPLRSGTVGFRYNDGEGLRASGGTPPYSWSIVGGGPTPAPGLTLSTDDSEGVIKGSPTTAGSFTRTYRVQDSTRATVTKDLSLTINNVPLTITTDSLPRACTGFSAYPPFTDELVTLSASGGTPPYTWSIDGKDGNGNPLTPAPGLSLSPSGPTAGQISGTLSLQDGSPITRTYRVQDSTGAAVTKSLTITVISCPT